MRIGFVGAGRIGRPMIDRLAAAGHQLRVAVRSASTAQVLRDGGITACTDAAAVAAQAEAVIVCVFDDAQVRDVCLDGDLLAAMPAGAALVLHTTGSPNTVRDIVARAARRDIAVIDAPISGGPHDVVAGAVTLFVGGDAAAVARVRPALAAYGEPILHVGATGAGQRVKLVNNAVFAANIGLLAAAVRLADDLGVAESALLAALTHGSAASRALAGAAARESVSGFAASVREFLAKDVTVVREVAAELGGRLGVLDDAIAEIIR